MRQRLHRYTWQLLPRGLRRNLLFRTTSRMAPRLAQNTKAALPIIIVGALRTASGLGESARLCYTALNSEGLPVFGIDIGSTLMQSRDIQFQFDDGRSVIGSGTLVLHINAPFIPMALLRLGARVVRGKRVIGYWAWELPHTPPDWRHGVPFVHEIWVPSHFTAHAVAPITGNRPLHVVPHPVAMKAPGVYNGAKAANPVFTVLTIFNMASGFSRKNPCAAIIAFRLAFGDDKSTRLIVKVSNSTVYTEGLRLIKAAACSAANIEVIDRVSDASEIAALYAEADAVLSLHRAEGFGLTIAEAMLHAKPVLATDWSGSVDFLTGETGVPVGYRLIPAADAQKTYHYPDMEWANPNVDEAASALRRLRDDSESRTRLGNAASRYASNIWSAGTYTGTVRGHLGV